MPSKKPQKKSSFSLAPITLSSPVKQTDGFSNLVEETKPQEGTIAAEKAVDPKPETQVETQPQRSDSVEPDPNPEFGLSESALLKILDADSLDDIYELTDVLRASSLKLYATLLQLADERGRARAKNHELMSKAGIKGIATLYKQERWLSDLKLVEKKAKPGPHDGSSYIVRKLETLPLPTEIFQKFENYIADLK